MNQYVRVALDMLSHYDCAPDTLISKQNLIDIFNTQADKYKQTAFITQIIEEFWGQAETITRGEATALTLAQIYAQAIVILQQRVSLLDGTSGIAQKRMLLEGEEWKLSELQKEYEKGLTEHYDRINTARRNIVAISSKIKQLQKNRDDFQQELGLLLACLRVEQTEQLQVEQSQIVESRVESSNQAPSADLSLIFKAAVIGACLNMAFSSFHPAFLTLLCYLSVIYWLFLGYYDHNFVKRIMAALLISCLLDFSHIILLFLTNTGSFRLYRQDTGWKQVSVVMSVVQVGVRTLLFVKMWQFREVRAQRQWWLLWGREMELHVRSGKVWSE